MCVPLVMAEVALSAVSVVSAPVPETKGEYTCDEVRALLAKA